MKLGILLIILITDKISKEPTFQPRQSEYHLSIPERLAGFPARDVASSKLLSVVMQVTPFVHAPLGVPTHPDPVMSV